MKEERAISPQNLAANDDYVGGLGLFADAIALPIAALDSQMRLIWCNGPYEKWAGLPRDRIIGRSVRELYGEAAHAVAAPAFARAFEGHVTSYDRLVGHRGPVPRWYRVQLVPAFDAQGRVMRVYSSNIDIDDDVRLREALRASEARVLRLIDSIDLPIGRWERVPGVPDAARLVEVNATYLRWARRDRDSLLGRTLAELFGEPAWAAARGAFAHAFSTGERATYDRVITHQDREHWMRISVCPDVQADGSVQAVYTHAFDIDEEMRMLTELRESQRRVDVFTRNIPYPLTYFDRDGVYRFVNQAFLLRHGLQADAVVGRHVRSVRGEQVWAEYQTLVQRALAGEECSYERVVRLADGRERWTRTTYTPDRDSAGHVQGVYSTSVDIHDIKQAELALQRSATRDSLTDAFNRSYMVEQVDAWLHRTPQHPFAVFFVDLDGFKQINDSEGHAAGDELLVHVAQQLRAATCEADVIGRFGGDEFVLLTRGDCADSVQALAERLLQAASQPLRYGGRELRVSVSLGVAVVPGAQADSGLDLIRLADEAMYAAKRSGKNSWSVNGL